MGMTCEVGVERRTLIAGALAMAANLAVPAMARAQSGRVIVLKGARHVLGISGPAGDVLVRDGRIASIGRIAAPPGAQVIDVSGCVLMPGLVDTHWHMWNSMARGLASSAKGGFVPTMAAISPHVTPADAAAGVRLALAEAVNGGITTVHNWAHNVRSPAQAEAEIAAMIASGVRGRFSWGYPQDMAEDRAVDFAPIANTARAAPSPLVSLGLCARGPDRSAPTVWQAEWDAARRLGLPVTTHIASDAEAALKNGIAQLAARGGLGRDVQLVHLVAASRADLDRVATAGSPVSISPWTELEVGYGLPPIADMAAAGVRMGLSVDNMVLAGQADMFGVMRVTGDLAAGMARRQQAVSDATVLRWATAEGAATMGLGDGIGRVAVGMRADLIAVRADAINTAPHADPVSMLTHAAQPANVDTVLIDGVVHKRAGRLTRIDADAIRDEADAAIARLRRLGGV